MVSASVDTLSPARRDVLATAYHGDDEAVDAWRRWRAAVDIDEHLDESTFSLLPSIHRRLARLGIEDPLMPRLKGVARQAWVANRQFCWQIERMLAPWSERAIVPMILPPFDRLLDDTTAVVNRAGARFAVRADDALPALRALLDDDWQCPTVRLPLRTLEAFVLGAGSVNLQRDDMPALRLEWNLEPRFAGLPDAAWDRSVAARIGNRDVRRLDPTDAVEFAIRQPLAPGPYARAVSILGAAQRPDIDWERLVRATRERPVHTHWIPVLECIAPLLESLGAPSRMAREIIDAASIASPGKQPSVTARARQGWIDYQSALGGNASVAVALVNLPGYLVGRWHLASARQIPRRAVQWLLYK